MFRFIRAHGGHANDGDSLDVAYQYKSDSDLHQFFGHLGIPLTVFAERPAQPEPGVSYPGTEFSKFPSLVPGTHWIKQPGHCEIAGQKAFVWCEASRIRISVGADYLVTEADVQGAEAIERVLPDVPLHRVDPPVDSERCICPKYYPAYFG